MLFGIGFCGCVGKYDVFGFGVFGFFIFGYSVLLWLWYIMLFELECIRCGLLLGDLVCGSDCEEIILW